MTRYWLVWCPVCRRNRPTRIPFRGEVPDAAESTAVRAEYDAHMKQQHGQEYKDSHG